jgi:citrate lyase gamma subunit
MTIKVGLKRMEFEKSKANIDEAGAIDALVKARSAILDGQLRQSSCQYVQAKSLSPAKTLSVL